MSSGYERSRLVVLGVAVVAAGLGFLTAKLHSRWRDAPQFCLGVPCLHFYSRLSVIETVAAQRKGTPSYLAIGDSLTEAADLPVICGRQPINAGISYATVSTFAQHGARLAGLAGPDFVVLALGTNDTKSPDLTAFRSSMIALLQSLAAWRVVIVPLPGGPKVRGFQDFNAVIAALPGTKAAVLPNVETTDGTHLTAKTYATWLRTIVDAAEGSVCRR